MPAERRLSGTVTRSRIAPGSKSDRVGVVLRTEDGEEYALRRMGGNAFQDDELDKLVDSIITANGVVTGGTFIMKDWRARRRG